MDFADLLSQGPLASVLNDYKKTQQNVLNRKVITKRERDNEELKRIQQMNHEYNAKKERKRKMREEQETLNNYIPKKKRKVMLRENPTEYREYLYKQKVYEMKMKKLEEMNKNGNTNVNVEDIELNEDELKEINGEIDGEMKMDESVLGSNNSNDVDIEKNTILKMLKTLSEKDIIKELRIFGEPIDILVKLMMND
eukprot:CAMPEP_0114658302 /NCGR_PEP_ID=MMETSP0191-20121206/15512_1 /TAXON_ID=126664 /ORGANISM="Sorites sp." /LENGTH=195 /DNA_ID=CAMNT_0001879989 /DNA_START=28 /DNA_END=616 /DNA_ORIENTATION=+